jgi:hypothetical protein
VPTSIIIAYYFVGKVTFSKVDAAKRHKNHTISEKVRCEEKNILNKVGVWVCRNEGNDVILHYEYDYGQC